MKKPNSKNIEIFKKLTNASDSPVTQEEQKQSVKTQISKSETKKSQVSTKSSRKSRGSSRGG
jgi:hypothetical protein